MPAGVLSERNRRTSEGVKSKSRVVFLDRDFRAEGAVFINAGEMWRIASQANWRKGWEFPKLELLSM